MTESWVLKLDRAEHHLKEVEAEVLRFSETHPYRAVDAGYRNGNRRRFKLEFTAQPDEMLPIIVGDVVHNIRSALDHVIVASVPRERRRQAGFPIVYRQPYDSNGVALDGEDGKAWTKMTTGLPDDVLTLVKALQPFQTPPDQRTIDFCAANGLGTADLAGMALIGRWDNADKHRVFTIASGLAVGAVITVRHGDEAATHITDFFCEEGAELLAIDFVGPLDDAKVKVEVSGTVVVAIEVRKERGVTKIPSTIYRLIGHVREVTEVVWLLARGLPVTPHDGPA